MTTLTAGQAGFIGKVPNQAEYLPVPTSSPGFAAFDEWLSSAIEWAAARAGSAWPEALAAGAMHGFVFHAPHAAPKSVLCGAIAPSRDSAGRQFPLALGVPVALSPGLLARAELLPFALEQLWAAATQALQLRLDGAELSHPTGELEGPAPLALSEAAQLYDGWANELPLSEFWELLGATLHEPRATLRLLLETLQPWRGVEQPDTTLSLRLPLGAAGGAALCFWLDLLRRYLGWTGTVPSLFWSHDGVGGSALVHLGLPPKPTLAELWLPTGKRDEIADLTQPIPGDMLPQLAPLPQTVEAGLAPGMTVAGFLGALSTTPLR